nr:loganic acid O-methyltransferase-like [Ziziphus jujuba var. spinosa]
MLQREAAENAREMLVSAIVENLDIERELCPLSNIFTTADLGCSTGPNTFIAVQNIIEAVSQKFQTENQSQIPDFQVYFSDHVSNDFNILTANLLKDGKYFAAGVPGSFHGRLFPKASLSFVYSSYALQWLSKAPQEIVNKNSPAWNKGKVHYASFGDKAI